jgi:hypothetical protein
MLQSDKKFLYDRLLNAISSCSGSSDQQLNQCTDSFVIKINLAFRNRYTSNCFADDGANLKLKHPTTK